MTATIDPSASVLSEIRGATVSDISLRRVRLMLLLMLPLCGGLVLSLASTVSGPHGTNACGDALTSAG